MSTPKGQAPVPGFELYARICDLLDLAEWDRLLAAGAVVCGSPDQVVEQIGAMSDTCGFTEYLAWTRVGGLDHDKVNRSMELMASKVMPQLRGAGVAADGNTSQPLRMTNQAQSPYSRFVNTSESWSMPLVT